MTIAPESILAKLPMMEIRETVQNHSAPLMELLPERRMKKVLENMVLGILLTFTKVV